VLEIILIDKNMNKIIIASGPVIVENDQVLLDKSSGDDFWKFCGGKVKDEDADLQATAKRRAREELGIGIEIIETEPFISFASKETPGGKIDVILVHYLARRIGEIKPGLDIREWKWLPLDDLAVENLGPNIIPALRHFGFVE
jgi:8-oxo-dGTP pyrophosphatase MutT (NUDIX family)